MEDFGRDVSPEEKEQLLQGKEKEESSTNNEQPQETSGEVKEEKTEASKEEKPANDNPDLVGVFNSRFKEDLGKEFEKEEDIKAFIGKAAEYDNLKAQSTDLSQKLEEYQKLAEKVDPMSHFLNEDEYMRQQFLIKNKENLGDEALNKLSALSPGKIKQMGDMEALTTDLVVNKGLTSEEAKAYINKHYDVEEGEEIDPGTRAEMKVEVNGAKDRLSKMYDGIDVPEKVDWESARQQLKESWESPLSETIKGLDKIQLAEDIEFVVDDSMKAGLEQEVLSELMTNGIKPTEEALQSVVGSVKDRLILRNMDKVVKSMESDIREKVKSELRKEVHNDRPVNDTTRSTNKNVSRDEMILNAW